MARRPIGPVDTIWLNMDRPDNLMVIDTLVFLAGPADWDRAVSVVRERLLDRYPVFTQRPVMPPAHVGTPHWEDDPDFDLERHLVRVTLDRGDDADLQRYVEQRVPVPLDRDHPLWELHLVDGYRDGSVLFCRLHHALADGVALTRVLLSMTDPTSEGPRHHGAHPAPGTTTGGQGDEAPFGVLEGALRMAGAAGSAAGAVTGTALAGATAALREVPRLFDPHLLGDAFTQARRTGAVADKLLLGPRPPTPFGGEPSPAKRVVWSAPFPLEDVKEVGRACGATVNDVLVAAVAGTLSTYMAEHGGEQVDVSTMVPVNVRPLDRPLPAELGNQFALVLFRLPTGTPEPLARIAETKRRMDVIKDSPEVVLTFGLIKAIGRTGPELERFLVDFFADKAIGVTTNVPGPTMPRYLAGTRISGLLGWVPGSGRQTVGVSIFTYAGTVRVGFKVDAGLLPDPERLVAAFHDEIDGVRRIAHAVSGHNGSSRHT